MKARALAYYLPQFHPTPENDQFWGKGFTEWTNLVKAKKFYPGHDQPKIPTELGFYDLRLVNTMHDQSQLAHEHGVEGFLFWHYWFAGRKVLDLPLKLWTSSEGPNFPFAIAWANQSWTGHWHGSPKKMLIEQTYPIGDDEKHFKELLPYFLNNQYFKVDGKPLFYIFRPEELPNAQEFVNRWKKMAESYGLPGLFLVAEVCDPFGRITYRNHDKDGFDAGVDMRFPIRKQPIAKISSKIMKRLGFPSIYEYGKIDQKSLNIEISGLVYRAQFPNWDNTPRSGRHGIILRNSTPAKFQENIKFALDEMKYLSPETRLIFIKSWNEWAEGNYLEPDLRFGRGYLESLKSEMCD